MKSREALNKICLECQKDKGKIQVACPFRSISNDYCDEYEQIMKDLEMLEQYKAIEEELGISIIEAKYVIDNSSLTVGYTHSGKSIHTDYGYIDDFIYSLREALEDE